MSADILREAATQIRFDHMEGTEWLVADLLECLADENGDFYNSDHPALAVAYAYLAGGAA